MVNRRTNTGGNHPTPSDIDSRFSCGSAHERSWREHVGPVVPHLHTNASAVLTSGFLVIHVFEAVQKFTTRLFGTLSKKYCVPCMFFTAHFARFCHMLERKCPGGFSTDGASRVSRVYCRALCASDLPDVCGADVCMVALLALCTRGSYLRIAEKPQRSPPAGNLLHLFDFKSGILSPQHYQTHIHVRRRRGKATKSPPAGNYPHPLDFDKIF